MSQQDNNPIGPTGQYVYNDRKLDLDGLWITRQKVEYGDFSVAALAASESVAAGVWTFFESDPLSDQLTWRFKNTRVVPGAYIYSEEFDADLGPIGVSRRLIEDTGQTASQTATVNTTYEARSPSALVFWEVIKTNSNGTGSGGNPAFPVHNERIYDVERGNISRSKQIVVKTGSETATETYNSGTTTVTKTYYEPYEPNSLLLFKVIDTFLLPGPQRVGSRMDERCQNNMGSILERLIAFSAAEVVPDFDTLEYTDEPEDAVSKRRRIVTASNGFPTLWDYYRDPLRNNMLIATSFEVVPASTSLPGDSGGTHHELRHIDVLKSTLITSTASPPASFTTYRFGAWEMPGILDISAYFWSSACGAFLIENLYPLNQYTFRPPKSMMTQIYTEIEWFTSKPTPTGPDDVFYTMGSTLQIGQGWQPWHDVLVDYYNMPGYCDGSSYNTPIPASAPVDWSTYTGGGTGSGGIVNTVQLVAEEIVPDIFNLWKRTQLNVLMR